MGLTHSAVMQLDIGGDNQSFSSDRAIRFANPNDLQTYNNFIRLLPARPYTNLLVQVFFTEANFLYGTLHQQTFNKILDEWWAIATNSNRSAFSAATGVSTSGIPSTKPPTSSNDPYILKDIHFFPALLLQVLATAVQLLPREHYDFMNQMKLGMCESFQDLSTQFSNASCELSLLLGGTCTSSLARVQQPFLRAAWLKNEGRIHEAWHSLGTAIRSAQEQGLHLGGRQRTGERNLGLGSSVLEEVRKLWYREMEKRVWINLYSWDR